MIGSHRSAACTLPGKGGVCHGELGTMPPNPHPTHPLPLFLSLGTALAQSRRADASWANTQLIDKINTTQTEAEQEKDKAAASRTNHRTHPGSAVDDCRQAKCAPLPLAGSGGAQVCSGSFHTRRAALGSDEAARGDIPPPPPSGRRLQKSVSHQSYSKRRHLQS